MSKFDTVSNLAQILNCEVKKDEPMFLHTSFKIGGNAKLFIIVKKASQLSELIRACKRGEVEYFILGNGSNLLVDDNGIEKVVFTLDGDFKNIDMLDATTLYCGSGCTLAKLCSKALKCNMSGVEFAWGIPGSVGGAVYMNAGAYGGEMKDIIYSVTQMDKDGKVSTVLASQLSFTYRNSSYKENECIILFVTVKLKTDNPTEIRERMDDYMNRRKEKQPLEFPSAGSVFKRPENAFAGALIEQCNLKGKTIGGAQVSEKHSGFIVNKGNATAKDVKELISFVQSEVKEKTGYALERELIYI